MDHAKVSVYCVRLTLRYTHTQRADRRAAARTEISEYGEAKSQVPKTRTRLTDGSDLHKTPFIYNY